jgi:hypothetical protein
MDRTEQIAAWQAWFTGHGIPTFPLFGILNGKCRCQDGEACRQPGKHPKIRGWRSLDEPALVGSLDNLGVSTDNLVVVDIDSGDKIPSDLPDTFTVSTGRGLHLWYWANKDHPIRNSAGWRPKIDIRSVGGLVAAPPSRHISGAEYTYLRGEIQPVPSVVLETQSRYERRERKAAVSAVPGETNPLIQPLIDGLVSEVESAPEGERNHTLFRVACRFFELAEGNWAGEDSLWLIFHAARRNGLSAGEIINTIESASGSLTK